MSATVAHAPRLAEGLEVSTGWNSPYKELIKELRELLAATAVETLAVVGVTEQARMRGIVAGADK